MLMRGVMLAVVAVVMGAAAVRAGEVTTQSLLEEMVDMQRLAEFPAPAYRNVQYSSTDRTSTVPGGPGWFANSDGFGKEPIPNFEKVLKPAEGATPGEYVVCDVEGPGAIVRTWTAAIKGVLRVTLDGADKPIYEGPSQDFLMHPYATFAADAGIDKAVLEGSYDQRNASYSPMPFAKRCRIVWIGRPNDEIHFYEVQMRLYEKGTPVATFSAEELKKSRATLERVAKVLRAPSKAWTYASKAAGLPIEAKLAAGERVEALTIEGPKAIERLTLRVKADDVKQALRQTVLHVLCDGQPWGQVQSPVGDFFGAAPGINPFDSVPFTVEGDGTMTSRFVMPFGRQMKIVLENRGRQAVEVTGEALPMAYAWKDDTSLYFRARWRVNHDVLGSPEAIFDLPFLLASGRGVYVGTSSLLLNTNDVPTTGGSWWGEGDEKIFVDGEGRPSIFGTGSEDYYNYAWSSPDIWGFSYAGQPRNDGPANRGFVTNHRWHVVDAIPFTKQIHFYMELFPHEPTAGMSYARIGYHYARPDVVDDHVPIQDDDLRIRELAPNWRPAARRGAARSAFYEVQDVVQGDVPHEMLKDDLYSASNLFVWKPKEGDEIKLKFRVEEAGEYRVHFVARLDARSGRVTCKLDGKTINHEHSTGGIDLNVADRTLLRQIRSNNNTLSAGEHVLTLQYAGGGPEVGLDFLWVQKAQ